MTSDLHSSDENLPGTDDAESDGFDDVDLSELEQGGEAIHEEKQYTAYTGSGGRVVARKGYEKAAALGESEAESKILKTLIIALALAIPLLTIFWQLPSGDDEPREDEVELEE